MGHACRRRYHHEHESDSEPESDGEPGETIETIEFGKWFGKDRTSLNVNYNRLHDVKYKVPAKTRIGTVMDHYLNKLREQNVIAPGDEEYVFMNSDEQIVPKKVTVLQWERMWKPDTGPTLFLRLLSDAKVLHPLGYYNMYGDKTVPFDYALCVRSSKEHQEVRDKLHNDWLRERERIAKA